MAGKLLVSVQYLLQCKLRLVVGFCPAPLVGTERQALLIAFQPEGKVKSCAQKLLRQSRFSSKTVDDDGSACVVQFADCEQFWPAFDTMYDEGQMVSAGKECLAAQIEQLLGKGDSASVVNATFSDGV